MEDPNKILEAEAGRTNAEIDEGLIGAMSTDIGASVQAVLNRMRAPGAPLLSDNLHADLRQHTDDFKINALGGLATTMGADPDRVSIYRSVDRPIYDRLVQMAREQIDAEDSALPVADRVPAVVGDLPPRLGEFIHHFLRIHKTQGGLWGALRFMMRRDGMSVVAPTSQVSPRDRRIYSRAKELADGFQPETNLTDRRMLLQELARLNPSSVVFDTADLTAWRDDPTRTIPGTRTSLKDRITSLVGEDHLTDSSSLVLVASLRGEIAAYEGLSQQLTDLESEIRARFASGYRNLPIILSVLTDVANFHNLSKVEPPTGAAALATHNAQLATSRATVVASLPSLTPILATLLVTNRAHYSLVNQLQQVAQQSQTWTRVPHPLARLQKIYVDASGADVEKAQAEFDAIAKVRTAEARRFGLIDDAFKKAFQSSEERAKASDQLESIKKDLAEYQFISAQLTKIEADITALLPSSKDPKDPKRAEEVRLKALQSNQTDAKNRLDFKIREAVSRCPGTLIPPDTFTTKLPAYLSDPKTQPDFLGSIEVLLATLKTTSKNTKNDLDARLKEWEAFKKMSYSEMKTRLSDDRALVRALKKSATAPGTRLLPEGSVLGPQSPLIKTERIVDLADIETRYTESSSALREAQRASSGSALRKNPLSAEAVLFRMEMEDPSLSTIPSPQKEFRASLRVLMKLDAAKSNVEEGSTIRRAQAIVSSRMGKVWKSGEYRPFEEIQVETFGREEELKGFSGFSLSSSVTDISKKMTVDSLTPEALLKYIYYLERLSRDEMEGGKLALNEDIRPLLHNCKVVYYSTKAQQIVADMSSKGTPAEKAEVLKNLMDASFTLPSGVSPLKISTRSEVVNRRRLEAATAEAEAETDQNGPAHERLEVVKRYGGLTKVVLGARGIKNALFRVGRYIDSLRPPKPS